jgi:hypothetical protein
MMHSKMATAFYTWVAAARDGVTIENHELMVRFIMKMYGGKAFYTWRSATCKPQRLSSVIDPNMP